MDRDNNFNRIAKCYNALVFSRCKTESDPLSYLEQSYKEGITDEFIVPTLIGDPEQEESSEIIKEQDGIVFFNFREERMRELVEAFANPEFDKFPIKKFRKLKIATFTEYKKRLSSSSSISPTKNFYLSISDTFYSWKNDNCNLAETEKYAHITSFFDGGVEHKSKNIKKILVPSPKSRNL